MGERLKSLQNGSLAVPGGRDIAPLINDLLALPFAVKVATQDYHPANHISFTTQHAPLAGESLHQMKAPNPSDPSQTVPLALWPVHCVESTPGADLIPELNASKIEAIVRKGRDSATEMYSGFADNCGRRVADEAAVADWDLGDYLRKKGITDVFVCGLTGDCCVKCTALDAVKQGFGAFVISDAVRCLTEADWIGAKKEFEVGGVGVLESREVGAKIKAITKT